MAYGNYNSSTIKDLESKIDKLSNDFDEIKSNISILNEQLFRLTDVINNRMSIKDALDQINKITEIELKTEQTDKKVEIVKKEVEDVKHTQKTIIQKVEKLEDKIETINETSIQRDNQITNKVDNVTNDLSGLIKENEQLKNDVKFLRERLYVLEESIGRRVKMEMSQVAKSLVTEFSEIINVFIQDVSAALSDNVAKNQLVEIKNKTEKMLKEIESRYQYGKSR